MSLYHRANSDRLCWHCLKLHVNHRLPLVLSGCTAVRLLEYRRGLGRVGAGCILLGSRRSMGCATAFGTASPLNDIKYDTTSIVALSLLNLMTHSLCRLQIRAVMALISLL